MWRLSASSISASSRDVQPYPWRQVNVGSCSLARQVVRRSAVGPFDDDKKTKGLAAQRWVRQPLSLRGDVGRQRMLS